jgi:Arc/MetJ-type ribon-helix-helix transcriptional regulator
MTPIAIRLNADELAALDQAVAAGRFASRSDALRTGLRLALADNREALIVESYRRAATLASDPDLDNWLQGAATQSWSKLDGASEK